MSTGLLRLLFVDDEPLVLQGLRDLLRSRRREWEMCFAESGEAALARIAERPFDVVVSDMRMPGMDGATLLTRVKERTPEAVRIILSGQSDADAARRAVPVAHQFLSKPCEPQRLKDAIDVALGLRALLEDARLRGLVGGATSLPASPNTWVQLTEALRRPDIALTEIAPLVERDAALAGRVLQVANSAFFALPRRVTSIGEAVRYLGTGLIRDLALVTGAFSSFPFDGRRAGFTPETLQAHSWLVARVARRVAAPPVAQEAFTAGLLHDVGLLVLAAQAPDLAEAVVRTATERRLARTDAEREILGVTHAEVGAYLLGLWGLPLDLVTAVSRHHDEPAPPDGLPSLRQAVQIADVLAHECGSNPTGGPAMGALTLPVVDDAILAAWRRVAREESERADP